MRTTPLTASAGHQRYRPLPVLELPDRAWPGARPEHAPRWLSTDLRDGNQALARPMDLRRKARLFDLLVSLGYREIEVGFPTASEEELAFVRMLIERDRIPDDVRISVLVPARDELLRRTVEALRGARAATVHLYNATCPTFRSVVFGMSRPECKALAVNGATHLLKYAGELLGDCDFGFEYSPELFNETEPEFALEVCAAVADLWQPEPGRELILNFPATVERHGPNVFADQVEWLHRNLPYREDVCLSVHPHNDRGTAVAAAEFAALAGAQRIEGCLFGGGERAGNVCLVTLALNLYTQGIDPRVDFSDLDQVKQVVEECTGQRVPERHPYAGDLVFTAFSGSHQDAINKGFDRRAEQAERAGVAPGALPWQVPYLPIDPEDLGRGYEEVVRINSQSGKGGIAYIMSAWHGLRLPRTLQVEFAAEVQRLAEHNGSDLDPEQIRHCFEDTYMSVPEGEPDVPFAPPPIPTTLYLCGLGAEPERLGPVAAGITEALAPWGVQVEQAHAVADPVGGARPDGAATTTAYALCRFDAREYWGAGTDADPQTAAWRAVLAAAHRAGACTWTCADPIESVLDIEIEGTVRTLSTTHAAEPAGFVYTEGYDHALRA
ncbi:2-isopropylmalate synthase [Actinospica durhamensis]|uniref:2-isopropylmalate synthase n=1 Tax=Actinospica durhamensis TaxID=1508375 RepID=A0A941IM65_9ACTN|nr:2-isopropylmalate synthase [Actinospica durhamensis]MBR7832514.1 2-isopropylmalate synthase [Actinospica durhamensis]